jgi:hypothetical protein
VADALGHRDVPRALRGLESMFASSFYAPLLVSALFRHFWMLLKMRGFEAQQPKVVDAFVRASKSWDRDAQNAHGATIGKAIGLFDPAVSDKALGGKIYAQMIKPDLIGQARAFSPEHLRAVIRWLHGVDVGVKTGRFDATLTSMQLLCVRIVRGPGCAQDERAYAQ